MKFAVAVDSEHENDFGKTWNEYEKQPRTFAFLVDHQGIVRSAPRGKLTEAVVTLLGNAGAKDVPVASMDYKILTDAMYNRLRAALRKWLADAPKTSQITGRVTDENGRPIPLVDISGSLSVRFRTSTVRSYTSFPARKHSFTLSTAPDGSFQATQLCKGTYSISFATPGKAMVGRTVVVGSEGKTVRLNIKLVQPDSIKGTVRDKDEKAIAGATVSLPWRHLSLELEHPKSTYRTAAAITDKDGVFRFDGLQVGAYTLEVSAKRYQTRAIKQIPAGKHDLSITLDSE